MEKGKGWVKLNRALIDWQWYDDHQATRLLIHLLISVNFEDKKWHGIIIKKGSIVLSWKSLSDGCGLSISQCRTSMKKLIKSKEVTKQVTNKFQVITLVKWSQFQLEESIVDKQVDNQMTIKSQSNDNQMTTTKERKERKEQKESKEDVFQTIDILQEKYLKSPRLISAMIGNKKNKLKNEEHLKKRLNEFVNSLSETGVNAKSWHDFTTHFRNWNSKTKEKVQFLDHSKNLTDGSELLNTKNKNKK